MEHTDRRLLRFLSLIGIICLFLLTRSYTTTFHSSERVPPITGTQLPYAIKTIEAAGFEDIMVLDDRGIKVSTTEYSDGFTVITQSPQNNDKIDTSTLITLKVIKNPKPTPSQPTPHPSPSTPRPRTTASHTPGSTPSQSPSPTPPPPDPDVEDTPDEPTPEPTSPRSYAYYKYCAAARRAGAAPIYRGEPGYRSKLDADNDGIACE